MIKLEDDKVHVDSCRQEPPRDVTLVCMYNLLKDCGAVKIYNRFSR